MRRFRVKILIWTLCCASMAGCGRIELVRQGLAPIPEDVEGVLYIATNRPIQVGIEGTEKVISADVGGYYLVHRDDMAAMVRTMKHCRDGSK